MQATQWKQLYLWKSYTILFISVCQLQHAYTAVERIYATWVWKNPAPPSTVSVATRHKGAPLYAHKLKDGG